MISTILIVSVGYFKIIKNNDLDIKTVQLIILLYFVFIMIMSAFSSIGEMIIHESKVGTIQQLIISPVGLNRIIASKIIIKMAKSILITVMALFISRFFLTNISSFSIFKVFFVIVLGLLSLYGIGLVLAIISLFSKEINILSGILKLVFFYCIYYLDNNVFMPFSYAKVLMENLFIKGIDISFNNYDVKFFILFFINSILYLVIGMILFKYIERYALKKGKIVGY